MDDEEEEGLDIFNHAPRTPTPFTIPIDFTFHDFKNDYIFHREMYRYDMRYKFWDWLSQCFLEP